MSRHLTKEQRHNISVGLKRAWKEGKRTRTLTREHRKKLSIAHIITDPIKLRQSKVRRLEWKKQYRRRLPILIRQMFYGIKRRIKYSKSYKNRQCCFTQNEFICFANKSRKLKSLYCKWIESNYDPALVPSLDRINNNKDYKLTNIQFLTRIDNMRKWNK